MNYKKSTSYTKARLNQSVQSYNYKVYGKPGEEIKIVCKDHDPVWIAETKEGMRFPVHSSKVDLIFELS